MKKIFAVYMISLFPMFLLISCGNSSKSASSSLSREDTDKIVAWSQEQSSHNISSKLRNNMSNEAQLRIINNLFGSNDKSQGPALGLAKMHYKVDPQGTKITIDQANMEIDTFNVHYPASQYIQSFYFKADLVDSFVNKGAFFIKVDMANAWDTVLGQVDLNNFSLVIVGIDTSGNYVTLSGSQQGVKYVYNNVAPCPYTCGKTGTPMASSIIK